MNSPQQLLLDLKPPTPPTLGNYVTGANQELLARLRTIATDASAIYLWGPSGCGKTHLLRAIGAAPNARYLHAAAIHTAMDAELDLVADSLLAIDDIQALNPAAQIAVFRTINDARALKLTLLLSGDQPPLHLQLREDLRTRIGQMLIYEVRALSDDEKCAALQRHAQERGMTLDIALTQYLLRHGRRDLPSLMSVLDALDQASLQQKRQPTLPLLRELLQPALELGNSP